MISKVMANNNDQGITVASSAATIVDSEASNNRAFGIVVASARDHPAAVVMMRNCVVSNNKQTGLLVDTDVLTTVICRVARSVITGNSFGVDLPGDNIVFSYGDNDIDGNTNCDVFLGKLTPIATR